MEERRRVHATPALGIPAGHCQRSQRSTGSQAGIVRQLKAIRAPVERRLLGNFKQQPEPPLTAEPSFPVYSRWPEPFGLPPRQGHRPRVYLGVGVARGGGSP